MATQGIFTGDGSNRAFSITFPYSQLRELRASVNDVEVSFVLASPSQVLLNAAPAAGTRVRIYRMTPFNVPDVSFQDGAVLTEGDLNGSQGQLFRRIQELTGDVDNLLGRSVRFPLGEVVEALPAPGLRAGKVLGFDEAGLPIPVTREGPKGDPGGNAMSIGRMVDAPGLTIPTGTDVVAVSGFSTVGDRGAGKRFVYDATIDATYVSRNPSFAFRSVNGRGFRMAETGVPVSVRDFGAQGNVLVDDTAAFAAAVKYAGVAVNAGVSAHVYIPNGQYYVDFVAGQAMSFKGESRFSTVLVARSGGTASVIDARRNRDGASTNTQGHLNVENLSINLNGQYRTGITGYGGSVVLRNLSVYGSLNHGIELQYVLMSHLENIDTFNHALDGLTINVDSAVHFGDVNTSINAVAVWSHNNDRWGFNMEALHYSHFETCTSQENGPTDVMRAAGAVGGGWNLNGVANGLTSNNNITLMSCSSEIDKGPAINARAQRNLVITNFFNLPNPAFDLVRLDNTTAIIDGLSDTGSRSGTYTVRTLNAVGPGLVIVRGGYLKLNPGEILDFALQAALVNDVHMTSVRRLNFDAGSVVESFYTQTRSVPSDYNGWAVYASDNIPKLTVRRLGGVTSSSGGPLIDPISGSAEGDYTPYVDGAGGRGISIQYKRGGQIRWAQLPELSALVAKPAAIANPTGGATIDQPARDAVNLILAALRTQGFIAS